MNRFFLAGVALVAMTITVSCGGGGATEEVAPVLAAPAPVEPAAPTVPGVPTPPEPPQDTDPGSGTAETSQPTPASAACAPHSQGYWHHQCSEIASPEGLAGSAPGHGNGNGHGNNHGNGGGREATSAEKGLLASADAILLALDPSQGNTCGALDADPPNDACEKAMKQLAAYVLNLGSGLLVPDSVLALPDGSTATASQALQILSGMKSAGDCQGVAALASSLNDPAACVAVPADPGGGTTTAAQSSGG